MTDDIEIIHSPLERTYSAEGHTLRIQIYRSSDSPWTLEIEDEQGTSTVWDDPFDSDQAALDAALSDIEADGIHSFLTKATTAAQAPIGGNDLFEPLSDEELDELDQFLLYELDTEDGMTLDMLDGYLHAIVIGPKFIHPHQWLPKVWGTDDGTPPGLDTFNRMLHLVMRHYNSIVSGFAAHPPVLSPVWGTRITDDGEFDDVEMWAYGFTEGVKLDQTAWQALLDGPDGKRWYRPIALLGEDEFSADQDALTQTPEQRQALAVDIESSLLHIHAYWLPVRQAIHERQQSQRMGAKVGRNEPCPCGSGKKFKKCCGSPSELQ